MVNKYLKKINGISTPILGISWDNEEPEKIHVQKLVTYLQNKRILHKGHKILDLEPTVLSLIELRKEIVSILQELTFDSNSYKIMLTLLNLSIEYQSLLEIELKPDKEGVSNIVIEGSIIYRSKFMNNLHILCSNHNIQIPNI